MKIKDLLPVLVADNRIQIFETCREDDEIETLATYDGLAGNIFKKLYEPLYEREIDSLDYNEIGNCLDIYLK